MDNAQIDQACAQFRQLLCEQLEREERLKQGETADAQAQKAPVVIGVCGGDGIGPIITRQARLVLDKLLADEIQAGSVQLREVTGLTLENRKALGLPIPPDTLAQIKACSVLLKGPTTTPKAGTGEKDLESANVALRRELDLFANVRPVRIPQKNIDWVFFRENTEGEYVLGSRGVDIGCMSVDFKITTDEGTRRIARAAFDYAKKNGKTNVAIVTKANIMKKTDGRFSRICHEVAADYPSVTAEDWYIDIMTANLINESIRSRFEVFLLPNLYGDIITDEAAQLQGGVGTAGSANIGAQYAMFEAIHGSAPRMIEQGLGQYANPVSILKAACMLLRHIGLTDKAEALDAAIDDAVQNTMPVTGDKDGATCAQFTARLLERL